MKSNSLGKDSRFRNLNLTKNSLNLFLEFQNLVNILLS